MYKRLVAVMLLLCYLPSFSLLYLKKKQQKPHLKTNYVPSMCRPGVTLM